jgi:hypothetical protein
MAHYIKAMNDSAIDFIYEDKSVEFFHKWKLSLENNEFILNRGNPSAVSAKNLLWQGRTKYDQIGHALWAWVLWTLVIGHPKIKSAAFRVGGSPAGDKAKEYNNMLLSKACGPFKANFDGGYGIGDGYVFAGEETSFTNKCLVLEVGEVAPETLFYHLRQSHGFARWPYHSPFVYVFQIPGYNRMDTVEYMMWEHLKDCIKCSKRLDFKLPNPPPRTVMDILKDGNKP